VKTPEELWSGKKPNGSRIRVWGSDCFIHVPDVHRDGKLDVRSHPGIFVGYATRGAWRVYDLAACKVIVSRDVRFNENAFTHRGEMLHSMFILALHPYIVCSVFDSDQYTLDQP